MADIGYHCPDQPKGSPTLVSLLNDVLKCTINMDCAFAGSAHGGE